MARASGAPHARSTSKTNALVVKLEELRLRDDYPAIVALLRRAARSATRATEIAAWLDADAVADMFVGEDDAGELIAEALVLAAMRMGKTDGANVLGMVSRAACHDPTETFLFVRGAPSTVKARFVGGLDANAGHLVRSMDDPSAPMRAACIYALAVCREKKDGVLERLLDRLPQERFLEVRATAMLFVGACGGRLEMNHPLRGRCVAAVAAEEKAPLASKGSALIAASVGLASALLEMPWTTALTRRLLAALHRPAPLPNTWGFHRGASTVAIVSMALRAKRDVPALPFVRALARGGLQNADILCELAVGRSPSVAALGPALSELEPIERAALEAFRGKAFANADHTLRKLGFLGNAGVARLLAGEGALWKPVPVEMKHGVRRWHALRIWRACARGTLEVGRAVSALTKHLSRSAVGEVVLTAEEWIVTYDGMRGVADWRRDRALSLTLLDWLERSDPAWPKQAMRWAAQGRSPNTGLALLRLWQAGRLTLGPAHEAPIDSAVLDALGTVPDGIAELARELPSTWRQRIAEGVDRETARRLRVLFE